MMHNIPEQFEHVVRCHFGGGKPKAPTPPPLPDKDEAADNVAADAARRRKPRGYSSTILTGTSAAPGQASGQKTLLGL
jgi:hypothetical protein